MDRYLTSRVTILRPAPAVSTVGAVDVTRATCSVVAESVPFRRVAGRREIGTDDAGSTIFEADAGFVRTGRDVRVRDIFIDGGDAYQVQSIGNSGPHMLRCDLRKVRVR